MFGSQMALGSPTGHFGSLNYTQTIRESVWESEENFRERCNKSMVELNNLSNIQIKRNISSSEILNNLLNFDELRLKKIIKRHVQLTNSSKGKFIIQNWEKVISKFVKITPVEYKKALQNIKGSKINQKIKVAGG